MNSKDEAFIKVLIVVAAFLVALILRAFFPGKKPTPIWVYFVRFLYTLCAVMIGITTGVHEAVLVFKSSYRKFQDNVEIDWGQNRDEETTGKATDHVAGSIFKTV